ncbi:MAG TPA: endonuclease/exonuclease/phosphatase family protein [Acidimicrobiales bacterium]|nr:endonuclease/exonuclease/phosphatase family protein [Acidimicrobiales bacterium]
MPPVVVASYNVHGGVDGWGRPFDVVGTCRRIDADVLVLQESWASDGQATMAERVAAELGYAVTELTLARGRIVAPRADVGTRWGPRPWARNAYGLRLERRHPGPGERRAHRGAPPRAIEHGEWRIAVLSRLGVRRTSTIRLGQLDGDPARRGAIVAEIAVPGAARDLRVVGTHLAHLSQGSPRHIAALRRELASSDPCVLAGDMNMWGPPLSLLLPGWSRAVRGRTWPAWTRWPLAQSDHILVTNAVGTEGGEVLAIPGSDHFPVRARLVI